jgi:hypothetical protein
VTGPLRPVLAAAFVLAAAGLVACSGKSTPEEQVRETIARAEAGAEARDLPAVMDLVAESYADAQGQSKSDIRNLMRGYFLVNQSIHLLVNVEDVKLESNDVATARVTAGMLGTQAEEKGSLAADVYEFDVRLRNVDGDWRVQSAAWRRAGQ